MGIEFYSHFTAYLFTYWDKHILFTSVDTFDYVNRFQEKVVVVDGGGGGGGMCVCFDLVL